MNVTIHAIAPPPKSPKGNRQRQKLTKLQEVELWSWYKAKQALGSFKSKARELGVQKHVVEGVISRALRRERRGERRP